MSDDTTSDRAAVPPAHPNPALQSLAFLVGEWEMALSNAAFLPRPTDIVTGSVAFEWVLDGAFLIMYMGDRPPGTPNATWLFGRDDSTAAYTVLYSDARGVSRVYSMTYLQRVWKMWRDAPGFSQRFEGAVSEDGRTIVAHWQKSPDGVTWEHDFDVTYTKLS